MFCNFVVYCTTAVLLVTMLSSTGCDKSSASPAKVDEARGQEASNAADRNLQAMIGKTIEAMRSRNPDQVVEFYRGLAELRSAAQSDEVAFVNQLAIFAGSVVDVDVLRVRLLLDRLVLPDASIIRALAPHLDSNNPSLRSFVRDWFQSHDGASRWSPDRPLEPLNFSEYGDYLRNHVRRNVQVPKAFVDYIYSCAPGRALLAFLYAHEGSQPKQRDILWSERLVSNAIWMKENAFDGAFKSARPEVVKQLQNLSKHDQWWVRLYVAKVMQYPDLRVDAICVMLLNDKNEYVRNAATKAMGEEM